MPDLAAAASHVLPSLPWWVKVFVGLLIVAAAPPLLQASRRGGLGFALGIFTIESGTLVAIRGIVAWHHASWWQYLMPFALVLVPSLFVAVVLSRLGWWRLVGFTSIREWRSIHLAIPVLLVLVLPAVGLSGRGILKTTAFILALQIAFLVLDVFMEEVTYRGVVLHALHRYGIVWRVLLSATLFGLSHVDNFFLPGADEIGVAYQILEAGLVGVLFGAARLRMNTIWPVIAVHGAYDFMLVLAFGHAFPVAPTVPGFVVDTTVNLMFAGLGIALVWRWKGESALSDTALAA